MLKPAYKVKHWYPSDTVTIAYDGWYNPIEEVPVRELYWNWGSESSDSQFFIIAKNFLFFLLCECRKMKLKIFCIGVKT